MVLLRFIRAAVSRCHPVFKMLILYIIILRNADYRYSARLTGLLHHILSVVQCHWTDTEELENRRSLSSGPEQNMSAAGKMGHNPEIRSCYHWTGGRRRCELAWIESVCLEANKRRKRRNEEWLTRRTRTNGERRKKVWEENNDL